MPRINFSELISFSSEDPSHPAANLLTAQSFRKWKVSTATLGASEGSVTIRLEKLSKVRSVDIGNEGCAFVEVLVARDDGDFEVLLPSSSFMSPLESRNLSDMSRVRMFGPEKLTGSVAEQQWSRVKVVCRQPFNKAIQYGLAFLTLNTAGDSNSGSMTIGGFKLRAIAQESEEKIETGSAFARFKANKGKLDAENGTVKRIATEDTFKRKAPEDNGSKKKVPEDTGFDQLKKKPNLDESKSLNTSTSGQSPSMPAISKIEKLKRIRALKSANNPENHEEDETNTKNKNIKISSDNKVSTKKRDSSMERPSKRKKSSEESGDGPSSSVNNRRNVDITKPTPRMAPVKKVRYAPFSSLLSGVEYVLSGFQNPLRSDLRDKMTAMGAVYRQDWAPGCTHLVCAFKNTPKYRAVVGKGRIVASKWVDDCHSKRGKLPTPPYRLDTPAQGEADEEEVWAEEKRPQTPATSPDTKISAEPQEKEADSPPTGPPQARESLPSSKGSSPSSQPGGGQEFNSDIDTDDEIDMVLNRSKPLPHNDGRPPPPNDGKPTPSDDGKAPPLDDDVFDCDTDIDEPNGECNTNTAEPRDGVPRGVSPLCDIFVGEVFLLYGEVPHPHQLRRYILAYGGRVAPYMGEEVTKVIAAGKWDDDFDQAASEFPQLEFLRPSWVWRSCDALAGVGVAKHLLQRS